MKENEKKIFESGSQQQHARMKMCQVSTNEKKKSIRKELMESNHFHPINSLRSIRSVKQTQ